MFARRISAAVQPGGLEELIGYVEEIGATEVTQQPGFIGAVVMSNSNADEVVALSFWKTEADMAATENTDEFNRRIAKVAHLLESPRMIEHFEVKARFGEMFDRKT